MKRHIDLHLFQQFQSDFNFLMDRVAQSNGEIDIRLRDNYFNLYYKGNSLAKIQIFQGYYKVTIHTSFVNNIFSTDTRILLPKISKGYECYTLTNKVLMPFFQSKYLNKIAANIKAVNNGEEITFEQMLITDNLQNPDLIIIDRQVTETKLNGKRLDLLALQHVDANNYLFLVLEVKLGNNKELSQAVGMQLQQYIDHVTREFNDWKAAYELIYAQLKQLGIFPHLSYTKINVVLPVLGRVIVGSYSGMAKTAIRKLGQAYPAIDVRQFSFIL